VLTSRISSAESTARTTRTLYSRAVPVRVGQPYEQRDQPEGVPPLALTGERTLPDVPEENYWFRRHLVVYEWIAACVAGRRVIDMACGEGYGSEVLAATAASVTGVDANPEAYEHARHRYRRANLRFERALVESFQERADAIVFLQTIEHLREPDGALAHFRSLLEDDGALYVSTPNVLRLAPAGAARSDNPWHVHEYRAQEFAQLCGRTFERVELYGVYHARKLRAHELALKLGWDAVHERLRLSRIFYDRFTPAISTRDFAIRPASEADRDASLDLLAVCRR
jgi:2-polyprenyl-3-methyl-5-hydroxy-6-metoxy-1,4-benzoquinol methylase